MGDARRTVRDLRSIICSSWSSDRTKDSHWPVRNIERVISLFGYSRSWIVPISCDAKNVSDASKVVCMGVPTHRRDQSLRKGPLRPQFAEALPTNSLTGVARHLFPPRRRHVCTE